MPIEPHKLVTVSDWAIQNWSLWFLINHYSFRFRELATPTAILRLQFELVGCSRNQVFGGKSEPMTLVYEGKVLAAACIPVEFAVLTAFVGCPGESGRFVCVVDGSLEDR